ncbi:MAG: sensor histidine kinase [Chitinophagaceae bacterium]|nr:sensor histidine kinase [Chitinophagaceae bacterium]
MMERVVQNLIENTIKNTPENGIIKIALQVENNNLVFTVENTGNPLSDELMAWINNPKEKLVEHAIKPIKSGLGLTIIKKILNLHGSRLNAHVTNSSTNIFFFSLPVFNPQTS